MKYLAMIEVQDEKSVLSDKVFRVIKFYFDNELIFDFSCVPGGFSEKMLEEMISRVSDPVKSAEELKKIWEERNDVG